MSGYVKALFLMTARTADGLLTSGKRVTDSDEHDLATVEEIRAAMKRDGYVLSFDNSEERYR